MSISSTLELEQVVQKSIPKLFDTVNQFISKEIELKRIARLASLLIKNGVNLNNNIFTALQSNCNKLQKDDGGWTDVEETIWVLSFLRNFNQGEKTINNGFYWLNQQRHSNGSWGNGQRDIGRIPLTGLLLHLHPSMSSSETTSWLENEYSRENKNPPRLTYKGAFFLLGLKVSADKADNSPLIEEIYTFIANEQNNDGGFGPWKDHPIGSEPWSTGIVLLGLLSYPELIKKEVIERAVNWLAENQLPNGLWPYHYIEEGSAYAYWGSMEALKYLYKGSI